MIIEGVQDNEVDYNGRSLTLSGQVISDINNLMINRWEGKKVE